MSKMLFVQSEDYWGYDASSFDDAINFYKFTWVVPESQYNSMSEDDQKRLYPCALFYVAGVTDNHNFLTLKITKDSTEAKVSGMEGTKRRTRRYEIGSNAQYSVGSYSLQAAPSSATNLEEIKEAVESGSTSEGSFLVSGFLDDAASVAEAVNYEEEKSAESFSAPITEPSGSAYEPADPTVANPSTEGPSESELITMSAEIEYAELGDESYPIVPNTTGQDSSFNGHGVPQWYGAEGSGDISAYTTIPYSWETDPDPHEHDEHIDSYDIENAIESEVEQEVRSGDRTGSATYSTTVGYDNPENDDEYIEEDLSVDYRWGAEGETCEDSHLDGINFLEWTESAEGPTCYITGLPNPAGDIEGEDNICEPCAAKWIYDEGPEGEGYYRVSAMDAEGDSRLRDIRGKFMNRGKAKNAVFGEVMSQQMGGYYRTGIVGNNPPVGQDISRRNPLAKAKYFVQPGVQNANSGAWSKGPNFQQARKIAKGVAWDTVQDMGLAAESFASESFCADCGTTKKYRGEEEGCGCGSMSAEMEYAELGEELYPVVPNSEGGNTALDSGYGVPQWYGSAEGSQGYNDRMDESLGMRHRGKHSQSMKDRRDEAAAMDKMHSKMGRKYDDVSTMDAQSITETLEEASPAKGVLVAPAIAAIVGILGGIFYARRS